MAISTHKVEIVPIDLLPHPNADSLSIVKIDEYTVVVKTEDWKNRKTGAYIQPDSIVPDIPEFQFLGKHKRITTRKFRGVMSYGLLMPAPSWANIGDDVAEYMGIVHYEPEIYNSGGLKTGGECDSPPIGVYTSKYDIENFYKYAKKIFLPGDKLIAHEKIHGANSRYIYSSRDGRMFCGSRNEWKKQSETSVWWRVMDNHPKIEKFCRDNPDHILYGEIYGWVADLRYGAKPGDIPKFAAFDVLYKGTFLDYYPARHLTKDIPWVPVVEENLDFNPEYLIKLSSGASLIQGANNIREGIVISTYTERVNEKYGRSKLKIVSGEYLSK